MTSPTTPTIEADADAILRASGSALHHYTMPKVRQAIMDAVRAVYEDGRVDGYADRVRDERER